MAALAHYVYSEMPGDQRTLQSAYNLLTDDGLAKLDAFFVTLDDSHPAKAAYENFKNANASIKRAIVSSISVQINCQV